MTPHLRQAWTYELLEASAAERERDFERAWRHLERAHVLSQAYAGAHVTVHARMLGFGWRQRDRCEVLGQLVRILVAGPGSLLGRAPLGNTGRSNVGINTPMAIPEDLQRLLDSR